MTLEVVDMPNEDPQAQSTTAPDVPEAEPEAEAGGQATAAKHEAWHDRLASFTTWLAGHLRSPRTRLCVVGVILLLVGSLWITSSMWTLPLIVVGVAMVVIAWVGSRLDGRFAVEWGEGGTQLEFRAQIKPPPPVTQPVRLSPIPSSRAPRLRTTSRSALDNGDVIEGEGHTVEIDVAELKTLIRAAEAREATHADDADRGDAAADTAQQRPAA
jgi:hypothetical protein